MVAFSVYFEDGTIVCGWTGWTYERNRGIKDTEAFDLSNWKDGTAIFLRWERR